jgi:tetratricopeptide (TPR) repeat protein
VVEALLDVAQHRHDPVEPTGRGDDWSTLSGMIAYRITSRCVRGGSGAVTDLADQLSTALAGRYRVERELGHGGMATVFLAEDLKHHRRVAIKVLRHDVTVLLGQERFLREIEIAARLQHPHILTVLDSGDARGHLYCVMPYVEGESLRQRLERERQLPVAEAQRLAREVADALDYAHRAGVVHRDIKPENILLQAGHAVVADFGIARAVSVAGGSKLTTTGTAVGTPSYMSPEQVMGSRDLDGRSDLYSLGCVLYEMLAGVPPFAGATAESLVYQQLSASPPPVTSVRPSVPQATARALAKCLAKTPADRFATAGELAAALQAPDAPGKAPAAAPERRWAVMAGAVGVIVLAFVAWRFAPSLFPASASVPGTKAWILVAEFDGPATDSAVVTATRDLVMAALDQSEIVATVPRDQIRLALESAGKPPSVRVDADLARELAYRSSVRTMLEGRVGRLGSGYSVVLRVVDVDSARVVLSVSDAARDEEALIPTVGRIAKKLRAGLGERRSALQATRELHLVMTPSFEAYRTFLKVRPMIQVGDVRGAAAVCRSALALDPDFAMAWGTMAIAFWNLNEPDSAIAAFRQALARPKRLDEFWRLTYSAGVDELSGDLSGALAANQRLTELYPQNPSAHVNQSGCLASAGRWNEALESIRTAEKVSPFGPNQVVLYNQFWLLIRLGRASEARAIVPRFMGRNALSAPTWMAMATGQWSAAESLATSLRTAPGADDDVRRTAATVLAAVQTSRGEVQAGDQTLRQAQSVAENTDERTHANSIRWDRLRLTLFSKGVASDPGSPGSWDSTTTGLVVRGTWAAATGDTTLARRLLATIRTRSAPDLARQGFFGPEMVEAWLAARPGHWQEVLRLLGPAALQGEALGYAQVQSASLIRWLVAEAYDQLDRPDSAAAYFERAIAPPPEGGTNFAQVRMASSFAHRRLVLLYARMGRREEARRHWEIFHATFTHPDPEMRPLVEEARKAVASVEGMARSARR